MSDDHEMSTDETFIIGKGAASSMQEIFDRFMTNFSPFGFQSRHDNLEYHPIPYKPDPGDELVLSEPWRVVLELYVDDELMVLGLDLYGDLVLGRGSSRPGRIVFSLDPYGAQSLGVSREHCMLRPTASRLFVIDQGSTNGTKVNGAASGRGVATQLNHDDILELGNMVLMVKIISHPGA